MIVSSRFSSTRFRYSASTSERAQGVLRKNFKLDFTLGSFLKQLILISWLNLTQPYLATNDGTEITEFGDKHFKLMGLNFQAKHSRNICCPCLDWSERRFHLGGQIGSALLNHAQTQGWIKRHQGYREVTINEKGNKAFAQYFNITI